MRNTRDFAYGDFMPLDSKGNPIDDKKRQGALRFSCKLGSCYDSLIEEEMNCIVPKHKSFLKQSDLVSLQKPTKEQLQLKERK